MPFQDLLLAIGEQWYIKMSSWQFCKHPEICGQCRKLARLHWNISKSSHCGEKSPNSINVMHSGSQISTYVNRKTFFCDLFSYQSEIPIDVLTHNQTGMKNFNKIPLNIKGYSKHSFLTIPVMNVTSHLWLKKLFLTKNRWRTLSLFINVTNGTIKQYQQHYSHHIQLEIICLIVKSAPKRSLTNKDFTITLCTFINKLMWSIINVPYVIIKLNQKMFLHIERGTCCKKCPKQFILKPRLYFHIMYNHKQEAHNAFCNVTGVIIKQNPQRFSLHIQIELTSLIVKVINKENIITWIEHMKGL